MNKGEIVLVPFPFDDLSSAKLRPALCLTGPMTEHGHLVLAFISSKVPAADELEGTDSVIGPGLRWFPQTGLKVRSVVKFHRLLTVSDSFIKKRLGKVSDEFTAEIDKKLKMVFDIR